MLGHPLEVATEAWATRRQVDSERSQEPLHASNLRASIFSLCFRRYILAPNFATPLRRRTRFPSHSSPTLEVTLNFIADELNDLGTVSYILIPGASPSSDNTKRDSSKEKPYSKAEDLVAHEGVIPEHNPAYDEWLKQASGWQRHVDAEQ
jgi:hypothetical protein